MKRFILALLICLLASSSPLLAEAVPYDIDAAHSSVGFKIRHLVGTVRGRFTQFQGTVNLDEQDLAGSSASVTIEAASIDTAVPDRDTHLRSADFFEVEKFPQITFTTQRVEGNRAIGDLTLHGVTKEVALDFEFAGTAPDPKGIVRAGFTATTKLDRKDFGIVYNKVLDQGGLMLGEEVTVEIEIEAKRRAE